MRQLKLLCNRCCLVSPPGHKNAVLEVHWTPDGERLVSCSPDKTVRAAGRGGGRTGRWAGRGRTVGAACTCSLRLLLLQQLLPLPQQLEWLTLHPLPWLPAGAGVGRGDGRAGEEDGGAQGHRQQVGKRVPAAVGRVCSERTPLQHALCTDVCQAADARSAASPCAVAAEPKPPGPNPPFPPRSCCPLRRGPPLVVSGGDDCEAKLWDLRQKRSVKTLGEKYQVRATTVLLVLVGQGRRGLPDGLCVHGQLTMSPVNLLAAAPNVQRVICPALACRY